MFWFSGEFGDGECVFVVFVFPSKDDPIVIMGRRSFFGCLLGAKHSVYFEWRLMFAYLEGNDIPRNGRMV